jgi:hypothetical protein
MKISVSAKKWQTATSKRSWMKLAAHVSSHYPKDAALHTALRGMFKSTDAAVARNGAGTAKKRSTAKRRPASKRRTAKRRAPAKRRTSARKAAPKRRSAARRPMRRRTASRRRRA